MTTEVQPEDGSFDGSLKMVQLEAEQEHTDDDMQDMANEVLQPIGVAKAIVIVSESAICWKRCLPESFGLRMGR